MERPKHEERQQRAIINVKYVDKLRKTLKVGDKITCGDEKLVIVKKFCHLVEVKNSKKPNGPLKTMTYKEIAFIKKRLIWLNFRKE